MGLFSKRESANNLANGTQVETNLQFEPGYEPGDIYIVDRIEHPTRFFCSVEEGIGMEFSYTEYIGNNDPTSTDDQFTFPAHRITRWK